MIKKQTYPWGSLIVYDKSIHQLQLKTFLRFNVEIKVTGN